MMKKLFLLLGLFTATVALTGCDDYDDTEIRGEIDDLKSRVTELENWCKDARTQIGSLQSLVNALETKNFITNVTPIMDGSEEVGYTISFEKGNPITIKHGKEGDPGTAGKTPIVGVAKDPSNPDDDNYYWTVKVGDAEPEFLTDDKGNKIAVTGAKGDPGESGDPGAPGHTPKLSVEMFEGEVYWKVDGEWLLCDGEKVPAVGPQGDAVFSKDGIDLSDPDNVTFTLADGTTLTLPRTRSLTIGFEDYEPIAVLPDTEIRIVLPDNLTQDDYTALMAELKAEDGTSDIDIVTRASRGLTIIKPTFDESGKYNDDAAVITNHTAADGTLAVLKVTIIDNEGHEITASRVVELYSNDLALAARKTGGEFKLEHDYTLTEPIVVAAGQTLTVDLNGRTINNTTDLWNTENYNWSLFSVQGGTLTIKGNGKMAAKKDDCYAVDVKDGGKLIIEDGEYVGNVHAVYVYEGTADIRGGRYSIQQTYPNDPTKPYEFVLNCYDQNRQAGTASIVVTGGTFEHFNPADCAAEGPNTNFVAEGFMTIKVDDTPTYRVVKGVAQATDLQSAIDEVIANGQKTIFTTTPITFSEPLELDGKGVTIEGAPIYFGNNASIKNLTFANGHNASGNGSAIYVDNTASDQILSFENCTFANSEWDGIQLTNPNVKSVSFQNCSFKYTEPGYRYIHLELRDGKGQYTTNENAKLVISNCTFENVSNKYCKDSAITVLGFLLKNMTLENNTVKGDGANNLTQDIIWICDGTDFSTLLSTEKIKAAFVYAQ